MGAKTPLTAVGVAKLTKPGKYFDGHGLYLHIKSAASRTWRLKYYFSGAERVFTIGPYPEVSLAVARRQADEARALIRAGHDPVDERRAAKRASQRAREGEFRRVAVAWLRSKEGDWTSPATYRKARMILNDYLFPALRHISIADLTSAQASHALDAMKDVPSEAKKARQYLNDMVGYAIRHGLRDEGRLLMLERALRKRRGGHIAAVTDEQSLQKVLGKIERYDSPVTRFALQFALLTALRPGEVVTARWEELDFDRHEWHIPAERMKSRHAHIVPLPHQAELILREMTVYGDQRGYVFPPQARQKTPHLSRDSLSGAMRRMGLQGQQAPHGFRATFRTLARERLGIAPDVLEAQLAHAKPGEVQRAYDHTRFDDERRDAMQAWADYLDQLRPRHQGQDAIDCVTVIRPSLDSRAPPADQKTRQH